MTSKTPELRAVEAPDPQASVIKIKKPGFAEKFKSKNAPTISGVATLLTALPVLKIGEVDDWTRLTFIRRRLLVMRAVLCLGANQGRQSRHAARHRR